MDWMQLVVELLFEAWPFSLLLAIPVLTLVGLHRLIGRRFPGSKFSRFVGLMVDHSSLVVGLVGNALVLLLCIARYIEPGGRGLPMMQGLFFLCIAVGTIALGTAFVGLPSAAWQLVRGGHKAPVAVGVLLCLMPLPLGSALLNAIADHYNVFLKP